MNLFNEMSNKGVTSDVVTYSTLIGGFCQVGRHKATLELFHKMQACGQLPDPQTYAVLLDGLCKNGQVVEAIKVFHEMEDKTLGNDIVIYSILIDGLCNVGNLTVARELFYSLPTKGLCKEGLLEKASEIFEKMDGSGCSPNDCTNNTIIQGLLQHNETSKAIKYLEIMVDEGFSANATVASMFFDFLSSNQVNKNIREFF